MFKVYVGFAHRRGAGFNGAPGAAQARARGPQGCWGVGPQMTPHRIQRKRSKGWRMPPGAVVVSRPSKWGNPCLGKGPAAVTAYLCWIEQSRDGRIDGVDRGGMFTKPFPASDLHELRGKNLACWCRLCDRHQDGKMVGVKCPDCSPCHADILLEISNAKTEGLFMKEFLRTCC